MKKIIILLVLFSILFSGCVENNATGEAISGIAQTGIITPEKISVNKELVKPIIEQKLEPEYVKDIYTVQLFKSNDTVGFSLIVPGRGIPNYGRTGAYTLQSLIDGRVLQEVDFGFNDVIIVEPDSDCITDKGIVITDTEECPPFENIIEVENTSIILNLEYSSEITKLRVLKDNEIIAVRNLSDEAIDLGKNPFSEIEASTQILIEDAQAQEIFVTVLN